MTQQEAKEAEARAYRAWEAAGGMYGTDESRAALEATRVYQEILKTSAKIVGNYIPNSTGSTGEDWFDERG